MISLQIPLNLPTKFPPILGVGSELKGSLCVLKDQQANLLSSFGDLSYGEAFLSFQKEVDRLKSDFSVDPEVIAHDLHPDYISTQWSKDHYGKKRLIPVQHHQAHIASVMAEHQLKGPVIGVAFDGFGLGPDRTAWGGEFLVVEGGQYFRRAHLRCFPLLGGDKATREIWRIAYGLVAQTLGKESAAPHIPPPYQNNRRDLEKIIVNPAFSPQCSSIGRLFDGVASLLGLRDTVDFEGQAAMELESLSDMDLDGIKEEYAFQIVEKNGILILDPTFILKSILMDKEMGVSKNRMATQFHQALIQGIVSVIQSLSKKTWVNRVVLSGGCFQNKILLSGSVKRLTALGFKVFVNEKVPSHDGGISLGQVWVAANSMENN